MPPTAAIQQIQYSMTLYMYILYNQTHVVTYEIIHQLILLVFYFSPNLGASQLTSEACGAPNFKASVGSPPALNSWWFLTEVVTL